MFDSNSGLEMTVAKVYLRYAIILFVLLLVPALNLSGITLSRMRKRIAELGVRRAFGATKGEYHRTSPDGESGAHADRRAVGILPLICCDVAAARLVAGHFIGRGRAVDEYAQRLCLLGCFVFLSGDELDVGGHTGMESVAGEHYEIYKWLMAYVTNDLHTTLE